MRLDQPDSKTWGLLCIVLGNMPPNSQKLSQTVFLRSSYEPECDGSDPGQPCAVLDQGYEGPAAVSRVRAQKGTTGSKGSVTSPSFSTSSETVCRLRGSKLPKEARRKNLQVSK